MKKTLLAGLATVLFLLTSTGIAMAGDDAKSKTDSNNSKITGLYDNVRILQKQIDDLKQTLGKEWPYTKDQWDALHERIERLEQIDFANRFTDMGDGTIRDNDSGLIWLKDASCGDLPHTDGEGMANWENANVAAAALEWGICELADESEPGDWRLPTPAEWVAFMSAVYESPALVNTVGDAQWSEGDAFTGVQSNIYWSTECGTECEPGEAWIALMGSGGMGHWREDIPSLYVWPVRTGN
ncbi:MAG: DUF1566 domain-containing protein [Desulfobacterales bacterium]|nr:DUF1566 domain-containing protein [Desulfobacterales bacterium]